MSKPTFRQPTHHPKGWGEEVHLASNDRYCGKLLCFNRGALFSAHFHDLKDESFYVLSGRIRFIWNDLRDASQHESIVEKGGVVDIPRLCVHQVEALEESVIIEVSSPDFPTDSFRVRPGDSQKAAAPATFSSTSSDRGCLPIAIRNDAFRSPSLPSWADKLPSVSHKGRRADGFLILDHFIHGDDCSSHYGRECYTIASSDGPRTVRASDVTITWS